MTDRFRHSSIAPQSHHKVRSNEAPVVLCLVLVVAEQLAPELVTMRTAKRLVADPAKCSIMTSTNSTAFFAYLFSLARTRKAQFDAFFAVQRVTAIAFHTTIVTMSNAAMRTIIFNWQQTTLGT